MIRALVSRSLRFRVLIMAVAVVVAVVGATQLRAAPVDLYPEFSPTQVEIQTEALGLSAAEVEQLITVPLEKDLLNGIAWLSQIHSNTEAGLSSIDLTFEPGTDLLKARQVVQERLSQGHALPNFGSPPVMLQPLSSTSRVMMIGLSSRDLALTDLSVLARWKIKPRLLGVPGVANVSIWGQRDRQLQVQVDPNTLRQKGVTLTQVINTAGNALWVSPLTFVQASTPGTGGFIDTLTQRFDIQHILPIATAKDLSSVTVEGATSTRLGDVASVVEGHQPLIGDAVLSGAPGVLLVIQKFPEASTQSVTQGLEQAMDTLRPGLSGVTVDTHVYQAQAFLDTALRNVGGLTLAGFVLLLLLLLLALFSWRRALVTFVTVLLSMTAAAYVLFLLGTTFNMMVLAGLAIALVLVIDDAVVTLDAIHRKIHERRLSGESASLGDLVADAVSAVRGPLVYATLVLLLLALPFVFLNGVLGSFARPAILAYVVAVVASTVVALTVAPVLGFLLLGGEPAQRGPGPLVRAGYWVFDRIGPRYIVRPRLAVITAVALAAMCLAFIPQLNNRTLLAPPQDRNLLIHWNAEPGTSLTEMARVTMAVTQEMRSVAGVDGAAANVGRALTSDQIVNVNSGELWVRLSDSADYQATVAQLESVLHRYPGLHTDLGTYSQDRVAAAQADASAPVVVRVYGQDLNVLATQAEQLSDLMLTVPGLVQPKVQTLVQEPTLQIEVNLAAAQRYGLNPGDVRRTEATYFAGLPVGNLYQDQKIFDVVVVGSPNTRFAPANVQDLLIDAPVGGQVRLGDIATVRVAPYPTVISHDATSRSLEITGQVLGRDVGSVLADLKDRIAAHPMPFEYHAEVIGDVTGQPSPGLGVLGLAIGIAIAILLLLQAAFNSWRLAFMVAVLLPLAAAGGVLTAFAVGGVVSLPALLGLLLVLGITGRNAVLLVCNYQRLEAVDGALRGSALVLRATRDRIGHVLLATGAAMVALLPLAVFANAAGNEVLHPLATVVLGGLATSILVTLFVVPALYLRLSPPLEITGRAQDQLSFAPPVDPVAASLG